jgi:hypothetical protein
MYAEEEPNIRVAGNSVCSFSLVRRLELVLDRSEKGKNQNPS